jgi:hypothetical protein
VDAIGDQVEDSSENVPNDTNEASLHYFSRVTNHYLCLASLVLLDHMLINLRVILPSIWIMIPPLEFRFLDVLIRFLHPFHLG